MLFCMLAAVRGMGQESIMWGPAVGYEFGIPLSIERSEGRIDSDQFNSYEFNGEGASYNHTFRLGGYLLVPDLIERDLGLAVRAAYTLGSGAYASQAFRSDRIIDPLTQDVVASTQRLHVSAEVQTFQIDLMGHAAIDDIWGLEFGLWTSVRTSSAYTAMLQRVTPVISAIFGLADSVVVASGPHLGSDEVRFGTIVVNTFHVPLADGIALQPAVHLRLDVGALFDGTIIGAFTPGVGIGLLFGSDDLPGTPSPPVVAAEGDTGGIAPPLAVDTTRVPPPPVGDTALPVLRATIDLVPADSGGSTQLAAIRPEITLHQRQIPFPGMILFDRDSAAPPLRYHHIGSQEAERYTTDSLVRLEPEEIYLHALNLLGLRLRNHPAGRVTLAGSHAQGEPESLARERGESVRRYLREVWGIARERIDVITERGAKGDPYVRVAGDPEGVTAPVTIRWYATSYILPPLDIQPGIESDAGVRSWGVVIRHGDQVVMRYPDTSNEQGSGGELALQIPDEHAGEKLLPLVAEIVVEDSTGARTSAYDTLALALLRDSVASVRREILAYHIDTGESGRALLRRSDLREIAEGVRQGDRIIVAGRDGREEERVAEALRSMLRSRGRVDMGGREWGKWETATPEGRLAAGWVCVTIEREAGSKRP